MRDLSSEGLEGKICTIALIMQQLNGKSLGFFIFKQIFLFFCAIRVKCEMPRDIPL